MCVIVYDHHVMCFPPLPPHFCVKTHASTHAFKSRWRSVAVMSRIYGSIYLRQSPVNMTTFWFLSADISARGCFFILVESTTRRKRRKKAVLLGNSLRHTRAQLAAHLQPRSLTQQDAFVRLACSHFTQSVRLNVRCHVLQRRCVYARYVCMCGGGGGGGSSSVSCEMKSSPQ